jgi:hypothetical protein
VEPWIGKRIGLILFVAHSGVIHPDVLFDALWPPAALAKWVAKTAVQ